MYILVLAYVFFKNDKNVFKAKIRVVGRAFLAFKYVLIVLFFRYTSDDYLYLYIRNLENSRLKPIFRYQISICTQWILCSQKNCFKWCVFKISDAQIQLKLNIFLSYLYIKPTKSLLTIFD